MRIIHIIPTAFDYFDDIKRRAFKLVGEMNQYTGFESEAFTLQYNNATKSEQAEVKTIAPDQKYIGSQTTGEAFEYLNNFDVIHLHAPFLGAGKMLRRWRKNNLDKVFVVSDYRSVPTVDLIAIGIKWYNKYYLKRLKSVADIILEGENANTISAEQILSIYNKLV